MSEEKRIASNEIGFDIKDKIHIIRGVQVMLDSDLAAIYGYTTSRFNEQVSNNKERFQGDEFSFFLTEKEVRNLISEKSTSSWGGRRKPPRVFTESGVYMLMTVLRGNLAIQHSRSLIRAFREMRHILADNAMVFQRLDRIELKQLDTDEKFGQIFKQLETPKPDNAVIFFKGQMWDATNCIEKIIGEAEESVILIDNYVDRNTLDMLSRKKTGVSVSIHTTKRNCDLSEKEIHDFSTQYGPLSILYTDEFHDRFLILDNRELYHIGASIKDAGKKAFAITTDEDERILRSLLERITCLKEHV